MTSAPQATLTGALVVPALVALALIVLLLRPQSVAAPSTRPPLPTPVVLDELVPAAPGVQGGDAAPAARTKEGLRSLQAR